MLALSVGALVTGTESKTVSNHVRAFQDENGAIAPSCFGSRGRPLREWLEKADDLIRLQVDALIGDLHDDLLGGPAGSHRDDAPRRRGLLCVGQQVQENRGISEAHGGRIWCHCEGRDASDAFLRLERHSNHGGGDSEYWILDNETLLVIRATPTRPLNQTVLTFIGTWTSDQQNGLCEAMAGFVKPWAYGEGMLHQSVRIVPGRVSEHQVDVAAVRAAIEDYWTLDADSSGGCRSGGDTWMQVHDESLMHTVEASCAPDEDFARVLEALYDAVDRRPLH